jgi:two-component system chemotaxis sensor kinase CheA
MGSVITRSNNPARRTPSRDFFFGFSVGGSTGGAEEIVGSGAGASGGGIIRESELGAIGSEVVAGSKEVTGGAGGTGAGSIGTSGTGSTTGGTGGAVTSEGGVVPDGGCVFD